MNASLKLRRILRPDFFQQLSMMSMTAVSDYTSPYKKRSSVIQSSQNACESMFNSLKDHEKNQVSVGKLYSIIQSAGIQLTDPRLKESMGHLMELRRRTMDSEDTLHSSFFLDLPTFTEVMHENIVMLHRIMQNDFCIPKFGEFCGILDDIFKKCAVNHGGKVADYIPQLARFDPNYWGVSVCTVDGQRHTIGDTKIPFCLQSTSKPLTYSLVLTDLGNEKTHQYVGYEPSGVSFNHIALNDNDIPHNPMVNAGAIVVCSLVKQKLSLADRFEYIMQEYKRMAGNEFLGFSNTTFLSERASADRNYAMAYYMREKKCFPPSTNLMESLDFYFQCCSVEVTCDSASVIASTLANGGICPITGERVLSAEAVRDTLSLMHSCGMYDYSGQFAFKCGLPSKSGVSGCILVVIPNLMGMCLWSPPLDRQGNSVRGIQFCSEMVERFNFHNYDSLLHSQDKFDPRKAHVEDASHGIVTLLFAAQCNDISALRRAYLTGQNIGVCDYDGRTALHVAAAEGQLETIQFLIEIAHIDPKPKDRWGFTPYIEALRFGHADVVNYFKTHCPEGVDEESPLEQPVSDKKLADPVVLE